MRSEEFAEWMLRERERATRDVVFAIGGAYGLDDAVLARAGMRLSFARWTLPHELARLVLAEQLYRAGTIVRGEPYHK
jgi:23S rRNA (pseudouridine1915-N3)-methyltransferase